MNTYKKYLLVLLIIVGGLFVFFSVWVAPSITVLTPISGSIGTRVVINGSGFTPATNIIYFNGISVGTYNSDGKTLTFTVPSTLQPPMSSCPTGMACPQVIVMPSPISVTPGIYPIKVTNANGGSKAVNFTVTAPVTTQPSITSLAPLSGQVGTSVTINGSGFTDSNSVAFGSFKRSGIPSKDGAISFTVPSGGASFCDMSNKICTKDMLLPPAPGPHSVTVTNANGTSNRVMFTVSSSITVLSPNAFILEDDGTLISATDPAELTKKFYKKYPDQYDFIEFHFDRPAPASIDLSFPVQAFSIQAQHTNKGTFRHYQDDSSVQYGSNGKLLSFWIENFGISNTAKRYEYKSLMWFFDSFYFGLNFHEVVHHWGVHLPKALEEATFSNELVYTQSHWEYYTGSWLSFNRSTREKFIERNGKYYFVRDCTAEPKHHDFDLYSMGLKPPEEIKEKLLIFNKSNEREHWILTLPSYCDITAEVPKDFIRKAYTIQDFINVLGPRVPSVADAKKDFTMAFVLIVPQGTAPSQQDIDALNWFANKFPVVWYKSTEGRSTINGVKPTDLTPPVISNVKASATGSSVTFNWTTNEPATSFVIYTIAVNRDLSEISPNVATTPPKFSTVHNITVQSPYLLESKTKLISIDENYNIASFDMGKIKTLLP